MPRLAQKPKVLLVYPRFKLPTGDPPLGLAYLASSLLAAGTAEVRIADATFHPSLQFITSMIRQFEPDVVGIYVDTLMYHGAISVARIARQLGKFVITGGPHATVMPESLIADSDIVITGEGEIAIVEIIERFADKAFDTVPGIWYKNGDNILFTGTRKISPNLDTLPFPALGLLEMPSYLKRWHYLDCIDVNTPGTNLIGSRGCPFSCTYCQPTLKHLFGGTTRHRSPENIIDELRYLSKKYHINSFFFHDDTLTVDKDRTISFSESLIKSDLNITWGCNTRVDTIDRQTIKLMRAAGLCKIHIGAESGSQRILDTIYQKKITIEQIRQCVEIAREAGVYSLGFFILGAPGEEISEVRTTRKFACSLALDEATFSILTPLPGSEIRNYLERDPKFSMSVDYSDYNYYSRRAFDDPTLPNWQLKLEQITALMQFYAHPNRRNYLFHHFTSLNGVMKLARKVMRSL